MAQKSIHSVIVFALLISLAGFASSVSERSPSLFHDSPLVLSLVERNFRLAPQEIPVNLSLPVLNVLPNQTLTTTLQTSLSTQQIYAADLVLTYDPTVLTIIQVLPGTLATDWYLVSNLTVPGVIRVAMAGATPITTSGALLRFVFIAANAPGSSTALNLTQHELDEGAVPSQAQNGQVYIARPVQADFIASPLTGPAGLEVVFSNISSGDYSSVLWDFGDLTTSTEISPTHIYAQPGTYTVSLTISGIGGSDSVTRTDYITMYSLTISGRVQYWKNGEGLPGVVLELVGTQSYSTTTDATGAYAITGVSAGNYSLAPRKADDIRGITAFDASLALQHAAGNIALSGYPALSADANKSGSISSMDASYILQKAVGLISLPFPGATRIWEFDLPSRTYSELSVNQTAQDFTALLLGDPSGNWATSSWPLSRPERPATPALLQSPAIISIQSSSPDAGGVVTATLQLDPAGTQIFSAEFTLLYDPALAQYLGNSPAALTRNWLLASNPSHSGEIRLGMAGSQPAGEPGALVYLRFQLSKPIGRVRLQPAAGSLNEGNTPVTLLDGILGGQIPLYLPLSMVSR